MNKTIKYNGTEVTVNWQSSKTRKKIADIFGKAGTDCDKVTSTEGFSGSIEEAERIENIYRSAFEKLFGKEKSDKLFPEDTGMDGFYEFIDLMMELKDEQDKAIDDHVKKFAAFTDVE